MNTLPNKVETFGLSLIITKLELEDPLEEEFVGKFDLMGRDFTLIDDAHSNDELAVVLVVWLGKYPIEKTGSQTIEINQEFPSLVAA